MLQLYCVLKHQNTKIKKDKPINVTTLMCSKAPKH